MYLVPHRNDVVAVMLNRKSAVCKICIMLLTAHVFSVTEERCCSCDVELRKRQFWRHDHRGFLPSYEERPRTVAVCIVVRRLTGYQ